MDPIIVGLLGIVLLILLIALGLHIGVALGLVGLLGLILISGVSTGISLAATQPYGWLTVYVLTVVPLFILMGHFAFQGNISRDLYDFAYKWVGRLSGGLAMASAAGCAAFAACTGSSIACVGMMGRVALPEMKRYGYQDRLATACLAASGTLGVLIPPSIMAVLYAVVTDVSVAAMLIAGIIPGIISALMYMVMIWVRAKIDPSLGPPARGITWKDSLRSIPKVAMPLLVFIVVIGGIFGGIFTPTEGGACGAFATFLIAVFRKGMSWGNFKEALASTTEVVGMAFLIVIGGALFTIFLALSGIPSLLASFFAGLELSKTAMAAVLLIPLIPLGMFVTGFPIIMLTMPMIFPIVVEIGISPIWFGILVIKMLEFGMITPPMGITVYVVKGLAPEVPLVDIFKGVAWFMVMDILTIAILIAIPELSTWLPSMMLQ